MSELDTYEVEVFIRDPEGEVVSKPYVDVIGISDDYTIELWVNDRLVHEIHGSCQKVIDK